MKILIITPRIPYPPFRGDKLKIYNISKNLLLTNDVSIITFLRGNNDKKYIKKIEKLGIKLYLIKLTLFRSMVNAAMSIFSQKPFQVSWFASSAMRKKLLEITSKENYDVIYFHLIRSAQYLDSIKDTHSLKVIDFTDAVSLYLKRFADIEKNTFKKMFIKMEQKRIAMYERNAEKFDTVFICSDVDKDFLKDRNIQSNIRILKNGVDTEYFNGDNNDYDPDRIIFTGNMPYHANADAAVFFSNSIFPEILKQRTTAKFYIVGQKPPSQVTNLAAENIIVTGFVPDIKLEYLNSAVNVAPMRFGAGTLNKVIESVALGVPVVSTSIAVKGLPPELTKYIFIADDPRSFADAVIKILNDQTIRTGLMEEGKSVLKKLLSWEVIVNDFEEYLKTRIKKAAC